VSAQKPKQVRLYLNEECQTLFADLVEAVQPLPESQLTTILMTAALRAMRDRDVKLSLPLKFAVVEETVLEVPSARRR
jgi:hypothetical protein